MLFIIELGEICFSQGKMEELIGNFHTYHRICDLRKGTPNTLTYFSPNVNNANIKSNR